MRNDDLYEVVNRFILTSLRKVTIKIFIVLKMLISTNWLLFKLFSWCVGIILGILVSGGVSGIKRDR